MCIRLAAPVAASCLCASVYLCGCVSGYLFICPFVGVYMLGDLTKSLTSVAGDALRVATAPVEVAVDAARIVTSPVADVAQEIVDEVKAAADESGKIG
ncbi:gp58 protein [Vibrio phage VP585]|uniref:Gp58 protein n=2 Tax=Vhmlvirus TaxID=1922210 RepID=D4HTZ7_9CAUD|nr:gp58 protein [Vibrio phage VP585]CAX65039.1 gp58 protein [Vibrio phage VP585]